MVGIIALWLGRRSVAGELSLPVLNLWLTDNHSVSKLSAMGQPTRPTRPFIPVGSVNV